MSDFFRKQGLILSEMFDIWKEARISKKIFHNRAKEIPLPDKI